MSDQDPDELTTYLAARDRQRNERVTEALESLTPTQRAVIKAVAVMGYVQGKQAPGPEIPPDSVILHGVIAACLAMPDLYPALAALDQPGDQQAERLEHAIEDVPDFESQQT